MIYWIIGGVCYAVVAMVVAACVFTMLESLCVSNGSVSRLGIASLVGLFWLVILVGSICFLGLLRLFYWLRGGIRQKR